MLALLALWTLHQVPDAGVIVNTGARDAGTTLCSFHGTVTLLRNGETVSPAERVIVYVRSVASSWSHAKPTTHTVDQVKVANNDYEFSQKLKVLVHDDTVVFNNPEGEEHNVYAQTTLKFEISKKPYKTTGSYQFADPGTYHAQCDIHPGMRMDVLVLNNEFFTPVGADGSFQLPPLPARPMGYELTAWERNGSETTVKVQCPGSGEATLSLTEGPTPPRRSAPPMIRNTGPY